MIVVAEAHESFSVGSELIIANEEAFLSPSTPRRVGGFDTIVLWRRENPITSLPDRIF